MGRVCGVEQPDTHQSANRTAAVLCAALPANQGLGKQQHHISMRGRCGDLHLMDFSRSQKNWHFIFAMACYRLKVTGEPTPEVQWFRDGTKIDCSKHPRYDILAIESRHSRTVNSIAESDDEAKFTCEATNPAGKVTTFTRILVVNDVRVAEADENFRK